MKMFQISDKIDNVSRIGIGCMRITGLSDEKAVRSLIEGALECGINFFDHADIYAGGEAETLFGNALTPQLREKMVIQTKCAIRPGICYDFSKEYILNSVDGSLKRLKTDYVDILIKTGLIEKLDKTKLTNIYNNLDTSLRLDELSKIYDPGLEYSIPYTYSATGIVVNKKFMKDYPKSFEIFSQNQYKGKMTMLDDGRETLGATLQFLGYSSDTENDVELEAAKNKLIEWKKNLAKFDAAAFGKSVATGEFFAAHGYAENIYGELDEAEYENFDYFIPKGSMMYIDSMAIVKGSPNLENAYKFLEFLYRPENFIRVYEQFKAPSIIKGIEEKSSIKSIVKSSQVIENAKLPGSLSEKAKEKHDKIWNEVKLSN